MTWPPSGASSCRQTGASTSPDNTSSSWTGPRGLHCPRRRASSPHAPSTVPASRSACARSPSSGPFRRTISCIGKRRSGSSGRHSGAGVFLLDGGSVARHRGEASGSGADSTYYRTRNRFLAWRRGVSISGRKESFANLVDEQLEVRRWATAAQWQAARQGLVDGVLGRFGRRRRPLPGVVTGGLVEALRLLVVPGRLGRRIARRVGVGRSA